MVARAVTCGGVTRRVVQHLINQRVAVGRTANHIVMLRTDKFRRHVNGQRRGIFNTVGIGQGVVKDLLAGNGRERDTRVEGVGVTAVSGNRQRPVVARDV